MPCFGFFHKVARADLWIVLDHVENNPRDAAFWGRRVRILVQGKPHWLSVPLERPAKKGRVGVPIKDMRINSREAAAIGKSLKTVKMAYAAAPHFEQFFPLVERCLAPDDRSLMERNMEFIHAVFQLLGITTQTCLSSQLNSEGSGTALLVELLQDVEATEYLCGQGAREYQEDARFAAAGIELEYNSFQHPTHPQVRSTEFVEGLSILDMLLNLGAEATAARLPSVR